VRGATITVKGTADCIKETLDLENPGSDSTTGDSPDCITEAPVQFGPSGTFVKANPTGPTSGPVDPMTDDVMTLAATVAPASDKDKLQAGFRSGVYESEIH
jgi:hypothetical protein